MAGWMHRGQVAGWTGVAAAADGLYGVSVLVPKGATDRPKVASCCFVPDGQLDVASIAALAKKITVSGCPWVATLNREDYNILVVAEPAVKSDEIDQSVRWAISTMIDYPVNDADVAWMKIPTQVTQPNRPPHLYVVATPHVNTVECSSIFKQAKVSLKAIDVRETAQRNIAALVERPGEGVALLSFDARGVQLTVTYQGELYLDRFIKETMFGSDIDDLARERASERIVLQVQRSLDFISRTLPFIDLNRVVLAPLPGIPGLRNYFAENLPVAVEDLELKSVFDLSSVPEFERRENQSGYFLALGAALRFMNKSL